MNKRTSAFDERTKVYPRVTICRNHYGFIQIKEDHSIDLFGIPEVKLSRIELNHNALRGQIYNEVVRAIRADRGHAIESKWQIRTKLGSGA